MVELTQMRVLIFSNFSFPNGYKMLSFPIQRHIAFWLLAAHITGIIVNIVVASQSCWKVAALALEMV